MSDRFTREVQLDRLRSHQGPWDMAVIGGGATGLGVALDAASRGYSVVLLEQNDFGKGTSSRSTKLVHGGVRYLQQGNIGLVREALHERGLLRANAPHLVRPLPTIVPLYKWWEPSYYWLGLKTYDALAGSQSFGASSFLTPEETSAELPTIRQSALRGGVRYFDASFDDARLLVNLAQTAALHGGVCLNYCRVSGIVHRNGKVAGVCATDVESGDSFELEASVVINATGPFSDSVRTLDAPHQSEWIAPSRGSHIVLDRKFLPSESALLVPRTNDGRVIFAIPWHNHTLVGTTDIAQHDAPLEPRACRDEIDFLLKTIGEYLVLKPTWGDIRSTFAGIRPLIRADRAEKSSRLARNHQVRVSQSGLVSILGGKWTIYRKMAEDCVDSAAQVGGLPAAPCLTERISLGEVNSDGVQLECFAMYGKDAEKLRQLIESNREFQSPITSRLPYKIGEVIWAARYEMARTVEDVLARRLRVLFIDAQDAIDAAPRVAEVLARELGRNTAWQNCQVDQFREVAQGYRAELIA